MKHLLEDQLPPSPRISINASSNSGLSRDCPDMGSTEMSIDGHGHVFANSCVSGCFPKGMDLNPARMVSKMRLASDISLF